MSDNIIISAKNVCKHFSDGKIKALDGVSADIHKGEVVVIIGPSGSGKSTFLRCLNLLEVPTDGQILFNGMDITDKQANINLHRQIMRVFPELLKVHPDVRFVIVGEGPMRESLTRQAHELGVSDHVTFTGPKRWEIIDRYYAMGDVFVSASRSETQGLTYIEAMASGLCVCAVNDACLDGVIRDGVSGILTEETDEALLSGLIRAFSDEGREIASHAAEHAAPFGTEAFAIKMEQCYEKAIAEAGK